MPLLTQKAQVTIPKHVRKVLGIGPGDEVEFDVRGTLIVLHKKKKTGIFEKYQGYLGQGKTEDVMSELR